MRLKRVVFPAPFGPMMARRSPGRTLSETSSTAFRAPKALETWVSVRASVAAVDMVRPVVGVRRSLFGARLGSRPRPERQTPNAERLGMVPNALEGAAVDGLLQVLRRVVGIELGDLGIGLDRDVPELSARSLLDLADVDVEDGVSVRVELLRPEGRMGHGDALDRLQEEGLVGHIAVDLRHGGGGAFRRRGHCRGIVGGGLSPCPS